MEVDELIEKGLSAQRESKYVEFKRSFDPASTRSWCGLVKEIVALTNTKGGVIVIGVDNTGNPVEENLGAARDVTVEQITDKVRRYTGVEFGGITLVVRQKEGRDVLTVVVEPSEIPLVFESPGTYPIDERKQGREFSEGTIYFRHGGKSEPANRDDIRDVIGRRLETVRKAWLGGIRKVVESDPESKVVALPPDVVEGRAEIPFRLSDDPDAPVFTVANPDNVYRYRQTEVVQETRDIGKSCG